MKPTERQKSRAAQEDAKATLLEKKVAMIRSNKDKGLKVCDGYILFLQFFHSTNNLNIIL